jgi:hypothetical protein
VPISSCPAVGVIKLNVASILGIGVIALLNVAKLTFAIFGSTPVKVTGRSVILI